ARPGASAAKAAACDSGGAARRSHARLTQRPGAGGDLGTREHDQPRIEPHAEPPDDDARAAVSDRIGAVRRAAVESEAAGGSGPGGAGEGAGTRRRALHASAIASTGTRHVSGAALSCRHTVRP